MKLLEIKFIHTAVLIYVWKFLCLNSKHACIPASVIQQQCAEIKSFVLTTRRCNAVCAQIVNCRHNFSISSATECVCMGSLYMQLYCMYTKHLEFPGTPSPFSGCLKLYLSIFLDILFMRRTR